MTDDKKQVSAEVDQELYEKIKRRGHGEISKTIREAFRKRAGKSAEYELEEVKEEMVDIEEEIDNVKSDIRTSMERLTERVDRHSQLAERKKELKERAHALEDELERVEAEEEDKREEILESLTQALREGHHLFPSHGDVEEAARKLGKTPEETIEIMQERHPDVPEDAFIPAKEAEFEWHGLDTDDTFSSTGSDEVRYASLAKTEEE